MTSPTIPRTMSTQHPDNVQIPFFSEEAVLGADSEIREAFRRLAMIHHPDRGGNSETMKEISWAYEILKKKKQFA